MLLWQLKKHLWHLISKVRILKEKFSQESAYVKVLFCGLSKNTTSQSENMELADGQSTGTLKHCRGHIVAEKSCSISFDVE